MEITLVKAARPGDSDRAYLTVGGLTRPGPVHVIHDLPHLVVESLFAITDGLWGELAAGSHAAGRSGCPGPSLRELRIRWLRGAAGRYRARARVPR
jgi:hypothetical protein